jgi:hypothetical protein
MAIGCGKKYLIAGKARCFIKIVFDFKDFDFYFDFIF